MLIDFIPYESWEKSNLFVRSYLGLPETTTVRVYNSLASAVYDSVYCLAQFMNHKKKIAVRSGTTWAFDWVLPHLYREAFQISSFRLGDEDQNINQLDRETSLVMFSEDHPITGEFYAWQEMDQKLNEKKIFSVRVSHFLHRFTEHSLGPYSVRICRVSPHLTVVLAGERFRSPPAFASGEMWSANYIEREFRRFSQGVEQKEDVVRIENDLPSNFETIIKSENRVYDRIAISNPMIAGDALRDELLSLLKIPNSDPRSQWIQTSHLCSWEGPQSRYTWWEPRPSNDLLRGLLVLSPELIKNRDFHQDLLTISSKCRIDLTWQSQREPKR